MNELPVLPQRQADGHKGTFGTVCVVGGQVKPPNVMLGAPTLAAMSALRTGTGLAVLALPEPLVPVALSIVPSAIGLSLPVDKYGLLEAGPAAELILKQSAQYSCLAVGPGLGVGRLQQRLLSQIIKKVEQPLVIDADGLNNLAESTKILSKLPPNTILTPHVGEFLRLAKALKLKAEPEDPKQRLTAAHALASKLNCVVVLKGSSTAVSDGQKKWEIEGNAVLGTAGSGDVLTGIISGLIAQFGPAAGKALDMYECACLGVYIHSLAAANWSARYGNAGMLATDLPAEIPTVLDTLRQQKAS